MEKILKNVNTLLLEVQAVLLQIKAYKDVNKIFKAFLDKIEKILLKEPQNDLMQTFDTMHQMIEAQELSHQQKHVHHMVALIAIQTIVKLGDSVEITSKKSALGQVVKTYLASKIQQLCLSEGEQFKNCLMILSYFSVGFSCWRKTRDHVPELYSGLRFILGFLQSQLISNGASIKGSDVAAAKSDKQRTISFENLFESVVIKSEKDIPRDSILALLRITLSFVNHSFKITNMETNFDFLYQPVLYQLQDLLDNVTHIDSELSNHLTETVTKVRQWITDFSHKSDLDILIEKPLIKIKQLDPRVIEKGKDLNQYLEKSRIKKKVKNATKKIVKEIKSDQAVLDRKKLEDYEISLKEKDKARKKFVTIMDNQALEIKRIKTTQINFDRKKKKGSRMAGNKTA